VTTPVDISKYAQNPCGGLIPAQLTTLGITDHDGARGTASDENGNSIAVTCGWETTGQVTIAIQFAPNSGGLGYFYSKGANLQRLADMQGQPAIVASPNNGQGACTVAVGASDTAFYGATVNYDKAADPCALAQQVAQAMTATIKSGG
jgi:hypothetical protein